MSDAITIKGIRDGLLISVTDAGDWPEASSSLFARIEQSVDFFRGAKVALALGPRPLSAADLGRLRETLSERGVALWAVLSDSPRTVESAQSLGLLIALPATAPETKTRRAAERADPEADPEETREEAVMVRRTLRSGRRVHHPGHVVVIGDVNPGAEIVAGGDIVVWGRLRGVAHAGAEGDTAAVVCALDLAPTQLRIASLIATSPERRGEPRPEVAKIKDGQITAERWKPREK